MKKTTMAVLDFGLFMLGIMGQQLFAGLHSLLVTVNPNHFGLVLAISVGLLVIIIRNNPKA